MNQIYLTARKKLGPEGKMISHSKSSYIQGNPENLVIFNSNVCIDEGKIWFGDIDITIEYDSLSDLAMEIDKTVYVLREMDGRFENEETPLLGMSVIKFLPKGGHELSDSLVNYKKFNLKNQ